MRITDIKETKRGRQALFADGEFLFSVDAETLLKFHIEKGSSLTQEELSSLKKESDTRKAKDQALRYLSLRAYAEQELYKKLCLKFDEYSAAAAVALMAELNYLDDRAFAQDKAKWMAVKGKSSAEIRRKLVEVGVDRDLASQIASDYSEDDVEQAVKLIEKMYMEKLNKGEKQKVMAALARRGFSHPVIRSALERTARSGAQQEDEFGWDD